MAEAGIVMISETRNQHSEPVQRFIARLSFRADRLESREQRLPHFRDDRKVSVDDVRNFVLRGLPHEQRGATLRKPVTGHQPAVHLGGGVC